MAGPRRPRRRPEWRKRRGHADPAVAEGILFARPTARRSPSGSTSNPRKSRHRRCRPAGAAAGRRCHAVRADRGRCRAWPDRRCSRSLRRDAGAACCGVAGIWQTRIGCRAGADAPPMGRVRDLLEEIARHCRPLAGRDGGRRRPTRPTDDRADAGPNRAAAVGRGTIATREDALRVLEEAADFFRRTEPHSPLAYTLREAVRRGRLTWPELLEEIVPDPTAATAILSSLGIRPLPPPE